MALDALLQLSELPRPLYGQQGSLPNQPIGSWHQHPWAQFSYAADGVLEVDLKSCRFVAPPRRGIWIPAGTVHRVRCAPGTGIRSLYLAAAAAPMAASDARVVEVSPLLREMICHFSTLPIAYDEGGADGRFAQVLLDQLAQAQAVDFAIPWPRTPLLRRWCRTLQAHPERATSLGELAASAGVSEKTLSRWFRQETGLGFRHWRQRVRLMAALPLLEAGASVTEVALACGYESISAFIGAFRKQFDCTPGDYLVESTGFSPIKHGRP
ncbi:helix-turn-helix transcriptional regulator [Dechloromonas sp. ZY10]|uniref:AraC family transcriptional regulator n=1 Tax=Dechloromonas aquae TaxID=2664436 RepID=UPI003528C5C6